MQVINTLQNLIIDDKFCYCPDNPTLENEIMPGVFNAPITNPVA